MQIEHAYVINLDRRPERMGYFNSAIAPLLPFKVERLSAYDGQTITPPAAWSPRTPGAWAILLSHRALIEMAIDAGWDHLLIFEDDVFPLYPSLTSEIFSRALDELPPDWDMCYFGLAYRHEEYFPPVRVTNHLLRPFNANCAHCYLMSRVGLRKTVAVFDTWEQWPLDWQIDWALGYFQEREEINVFSSHPTLFGQSAGISDNGDEWLPERRYEPVRIIEGRPQYLSFT